MDRVSAVKPPRCSMLRAASWITRLITRATVANGLPARPHRRFSMGFWHLEPMLLTLHATIVLPVPIRTLCRAVAEVLLMTPDYLLQKVEHVADGVLKEEGFSGYRAYVVRAGRGAPVGRTGRFARPHGCSYWRRPAPPLADHRLHHQPRPCWLTGGARIALRSSSANKDGQIGARNLGIGHWRRCSG